MLTPIEMNEMEAILRDIQAREARIDAEEERLDRERDDLEEAKQAYETLLAYRNRMAHGDSLPGTPLEIDLGLSLAERITDYSDLSLKDAVKKAASTVGKRQKSFSSTDLVKHFGRLPDSQRPVADLEKNKSNISTFLKELVGAGFIDELEPARGQRPAQYAISVRTPILNHSL